MSKPTVEPDAPLTADELADLRIGEVQERSDRANHRGRIALIAAAATAAGLIAAAPVAGYMMAGPDEGHDQTPVAVVTGATTGASAHAEQTVQSGTPIALTVPGGKLTGTINVTSDRLTGNVVVTDTDDKIEDGVYYTIYKREPRGGGRTEDLVTARGILNPFQDQETASLDDDPSPGGEKLSGARVVLKVGDHEQSVVVPVGPPQKARALGAGPGGLTTSHSPDRTVAGRTPPRRKV